MTTVETNSGGGPAEGFAIVALLVGAISLGALVGWLSPEMGERLSGGVDPTLLLLVALLFFEVRLRAVAAGFANLRFMEIAWGANFLIVPVIGFASASLFLSGQPLLFTGLLIYFISPCTNWFLGFTRMARGDTALGAALIPVNMVSQLLLYPVWLWLFTRHTGVSDFGTIPEVLLHWFLVPFAATQALRFVLEKLLPEASFVRLSDGVGFAVPLVTAALIVQIFAANIGTIAGHLAAFGIILVAIFLFFVATFLMSEGLGPNLPAALSAAGPAGDDYGRAQRAADAGGDGGGDPGPAADPCRHRHRDAGRIPPSDRAEAGPARAAPPERSFPMKPGKPADQIPVFLLTGFLGAGKTTILNRILENPAFHDTALVINEFGLVPVDHDLVREGKEQPMVTTTGCICCTVGSDLRSSLDELLVGRRDGSLPPFSRVIVETTGLADPAPIINSLIPGGVVAMSLRDHAVARAFRLSGVIAVVDVQGIGAVLDSHPESLRQIAFADHVVLTRTDAASAGDWPEKLKRLNPGLRIHDGADPSFQPAVLLEPASYSAFGKGEGVEAWLAAPVAKTSARDRGQCRSRPPAPRPNRGPDADAGYGADLGLCAACRADLPARGRKRPPAQVNCLAALRTALRQWSGMPLCPDRLCPRCSGRRREHQAQCRRPTAQTILDISLNPNPKRRWQWCRHDPSSQMEGKHDQHRDGTPSD